MIPGSRRPGTLVKILSRQDEVDGLRAIAVIAVVLYHFSNQALPAGFLGVDIFFVISGYVISQSIVRNIQRGDFSLLRFWSRRVRRLAPAFLVVVLLTLIATPFFLPPSAQKVVSTDAISALLGVSNLRFMSFSTYEAMTPGTNPLLHSWSLGVEEQFYLLLPIMAIIVAKGRLFLSGKLNGSLSWKSIAAAAGIVTLILFLLSMLSLSFFHPRVHYFSPMSRAWELAVGVFISLLKLGNGYSRLRSQIRSSARIAVQILALGILVWCLITLEELVSGPSISSVLPVLATATLILSAKSGDAPKEQPNKLTRLALDNPILVHIGKRSYSIYLAHYPIIGLVSCTPLVQHDLLYLMSAVLVTLVASEVLYRQVEVRFQEGQVRAPTSMRVPAALLISNLLIAGASWTSGGYELRSNWPDSGKPMARNFPMESALQAGDGKYDSIALVGDSHAATLVDAFLDSAAAHDVLLSAWPVPGCPFLVGIESANISTDKTNETCTVDFQKTRLDWLITNKPKAVVLFSRWTANFEGSFFSDGTRLGTEAGKYTDYLRAPGTLGYVPSQSREQALAALRETISILESEGIRVLLILPVPEIGWDVPRTLYAWNLHWPPSQYPIVSRSTALKRNLSTEIALRDSGSDLTLFVSGVDLFCSSHGDQTCTTFSLEAPLYYDDDHLSYAGANRLVQEILAMLEPGERLLR